MIGGDQDLCTLIRQKDHLGVLRHVRTHKLRSPKLVIHHANILLGKDLDSSSSISDAERLSVLEQLLFAALDVSDPDLADKCLVVIRKTKGVPQNSARLRRLVGQFFEGIGDIEKATEVYDGLLKENPANAIAMKRKYMVLAAIPGKEIEARNALIQYVKYQQGDSGAWMEMHHKCMEVGDYNGAAFCMEEVLLSSPLDAKLHCLLGELYATIGGMNNLILARKHFSMSLELKNPERGNLRALFSLVSVTDTFIEECARSSAKTGKKSQKEIDVEHDIEVAKELIKFGGEKILAFYTRGAKESKLAKAVVDVISSYQA